MKKYGYTAVAFAVLLLTACGDQDDPSIGYAEISAEADTPPVMEGVSLYNEIYLWPEQEVYSPDTEQIKITVSNNTDEEIVFSSSKFQLFRTDENGGKTAVPYKFGGDYFMELGQLAAPHDTTVFMAQIAEHYDLPLAEGAYILAIDDMQTGFTVSQDAAALVSAEANISVATEFESYPPGTGQVKVLITNDSDSRYVYNADAFGLEHFDEGSVSLTGFAGELSCCQPQYGIAEPHETGEWIVYFRDYGDSPLPAGEYAVYLNGMEARFSITG